MVPSQEKLSTHLLHFPKVRVVIIMYLNTIFYKHTSLFLKPTGNNSGNVGNPSTRPTWSTSDESSARSPGLTLPCPKASPPLGTPSQSDLHSLLDRRPTHHLFHLPQLLPLIHHYCNHSHQPAGILLLQATSLLSSLSRMIQKRNMLRAQLMNLPAPAAGRPQISPSDITEEPEEEQ
ncbi:uncharacterized protein LOC143020602 isoform X2 [Oratosquilla oratoria]|uniref:uncharacterized protein LOC143020602 isoform X2 n=1 Tax=Oratosquilla oratoria TaxID=337810 RepID=UPI003F761EA2